MSTIRPTGPGPSMLRINGQEVTTRPSAPVAAPKPAIGPATDKAVTPTGDTSHLQEEMYDAAHMASIRGENAAAALHGKKRPRTREIKKKKSNPLAEHKRIEGIFPDGDPFNRQEKAFETAAEFEEQVQSAELSFKHPAGQVQVFALGLQANIDPHERDTERGRRPQPMKVSVRERPPPEPMPCEETVPRVQVSVSETGPRRVLGLRKK